MLKRSVVEIPVMAFQCCPPSTVLIIRPPSPTAQASVAETATTLFNVVVLLLVCVVQVAPLVVVYMMVPLLPTAQACVADGADTPYRMFGEPVLYPIQATPLKLATTPVSTPVALVPKPAAQAWPWGNAIRE